VVAGLALVALGALVSLAAALGLGRLPGDLELRGRHVRVFVPITSSIVLSVVATILLNLLVRR
jgi:hypothetical protein